MGWERALAIFEFGMRLIPPSLPHTCLRCYEPLVDIEKFSSEFAETFRI